MSLEPGLIAYAGLAGLAMAGNRHRVTARQLKLRPAAARILGALLLFGSIVAAIMQFGPAQGIVAWVGQLSIAGTALVLIMSWHPRAAILLALTAVLAAFL